MYVRCCLASLLMACPVVADSLDLELRFQQETSQSSGRYHRLTRSESWQAGETAIIVCDVWDVHHCRNAVKRVEEFAPRLNKLLKVAREQGVTIIHAPSDCMEAYRDHPARLRAIATPVAIRPPKDVGLWCSRIPNEEQSVYPIDQSDGGEDDEQSEHAAWVEHLKAMGRNPGMPWKKQTELIAIDDERDYISDQGAEVWNVLQHRKINNVMLAGVHVNMCVLGRPFGLRQMVRNGKHAVLIRDMTDTMYNPQRWPYVSHFTATDLVISHIEKFVCPTISSDQILGGKPFSFAGDKRPHVAIVIAEALYDTQRTLPEFALAQLGKDFRVSYFFANENDDKGIGGLEKISEADLALISARRQLLPSASMRALKKFVADGKPVVGIRTASHAFSIRSGDIPAGLADWPEFDADVLGGNYHGHHANDLKSTIQMANGAAHPILDQVANRFPQQGSLYQTSPLAQGTTTLLLGIADGVDSEPVAWTFARRDGGRSFYTSLGHADDFGNENFVRLLRNAVHWAVGSTPEPDLNPNPERGIADHWSLVQVPTQEPQANWFRCAVRIPGNWCDDLRFEGLVDGEAWINGHPIPNGKVSRDAIQADELNLLTVKSPTGLPTAPVATSHGNRLVLAGRWQARQGDNPAWANIPLPAKFGASTDIVFEPKGSEKQ